MNKRIKARPRLNYVYSALVASTAALAAGAVGAQQVNANGTAVDIPANTTIDTGTTGGVAGNAIRVQNGGSVTALGPITIITGGNAAQAVVVTGSAGGGGIISLEQGGSITTTGDVVAYGLVAAGDGSKAGTIRGRGLTINTSGTSALASRGGSVILVNSDLVSSQGFGFHALGTNALGDVTTIHGTDVSVATSSGQAVEAYGYATVLLDTSQRAANTITAKTGEGILAQQHGVVQTTGGLMVSAAGANTAGVRARSAGQVRITGSGASSSKIETTGSGSSGLNATDAGSSIVASGLTVSTANTQARGAFAASGGNIALSDSVITTVGDDSRAVNASGTGSVVTATGVQASTQGARAHGAYAQSAGSITLDNSSLSTTGANAHGVFAQLTDAVVNATAVKITTTGQDAHGADALTGAKVVINGASNITTSGINGVGLIAEVDTTPAVADTVLTFNGAAGASVTTSGDFAHAALACTRLSSGPGCAIGTSNADVPTGTGSRAVVNVSNATLSTTGASAYGLFAWGSSAELNASAVDVSTGGANAHASVARNGGTLAVAGSTLNTTGANAAAVYTTGPAGVTSTINLSDSTLTTVQGPSIQADGGSANITFTNSKAEKNNGLWLQVGSSDAANPANLNITVDPSTLVGAAVTQAGSTSNVTLADSQWTMTGNSNVTTLNNIRSVIQFSAPGGAIDQQSSYKTLTAVNYLGQGGTIGLNTYLGGDGSPSDRLVVDGGSASGSTSLRINNSGGPGAFTPGNGIQVVSANNGATTEAGAFTLGSRVVGGAYEYQLYRGSADASDAQGWYLRSARPAQPPVPPESPPVAAPPSPPAAPPVLLPLYRPEVGAYLANQHETANMFVHSLHDRLGEPQWIEGQNSGQSSAGSKQQGDKRSSAWLRVVGRVTDTNSADGGFGVSTENVLLHGGGDVASWGVGGDAGRLHLGGMLGYGGSRTDARAADNPYSAKGKSEGWNVGAYGTWYQNDQDKLGWYADVWGTYGWYKNTVDGQGLPSVRYNSTGLTLSGETGYAFKPLQDSTWVIEPQAQLIYAKADQDDVLEANGTRITNAEGSGWISRLGVRTYGTWVGDDGVRAQPYLTLNWWRDSTDAALAFNQVPISGLYPKDRYEVKMGVNADLTNGWTGWVNVGHQWGKQGFQAVTYRVGAKYSW